MKILVDADACPVKNIIEEVAQKFDVKVVMVCNWHHEISSQHAQVIVVDDLSQEADVVLANLTEKEDIVVTGDYGLAAMVLGKGAAAVDHSGREYHLSNIDFLLMQRYLNQKGRREGYRISRPLKRQKEDNVRFRQLLEHTIIKLQSM